MSKILKKFCGIFGYKLLPKNYIKNKNYLLNFSSLKLEKIIAYLAEKKIINSLVQIGANDGVSHDHLHNIIKKFQLKSLLLEPIKKYFLDLQNNYLNFDNVKIENSALSVNNEITFLYMVNPEYSNKYGTISSGISSFYKKHLIRHGIKKKHIVQEKVNQISFDVLLQKYNFKSFDLLLIDTEGYDCQIVNDFFLKIKKIRPIIIFEWSHIKNSELEDTLYIIIKNNYSFFPIGDDVFCYPSEKDISFKLN
jgi:FkbM family methyltransferase